MQEGYGFITFENDDCIQRAVQACQNVIVQGMTLKCTITHQHNPIGSKKMSHNKGRSPTHALNGPNAQAGPMSASAAPGAYYNGMSALPMGAVPSAAASSTAVPGHNGMMSMSAPSSARGMNGSNMHHHAMQSSYAAHAHQQQQGPAASFQPMNQQQMSFLQQAKAHQMPVPQSIVIANNGHHVANTAGPSVGSSAANTSSGYPSSYLSYNSPHHHSDSASTTSSLDSNSDLELRYSNGSVSGNGSGNGSNNQNNGLMSLASLGGVFGNNSSNTAAIDALNLNW
jgi:hypothetical protein